MPNHVQPSGDDLPWKKEVDRELEALRRELEQVKQQVKAGR